MSRDPQLMLEGWIALHGRHLDRRPSPVRRRLVAARYLDAAHAQARAGHAWGLSRRNLRMAIQTLPPVALDRRSRVIARCAIRRPRG
jgi:hypothetical protein